MTHLIALGLGLAVTVGGLAACYLLAGRDHRARVTAQRIRHTAEYHQSLYVHTRDDGHTPSDIPEVEAFLAGNDYESAPPGGVSCDG